MMKPNKIKIGSRVGLICPASPVNEEEIKIAETTLKDIGLVPVLGDHLVNKGSYLSGTDIERAEDIKRFFEAADIGAIFCIRGGYGSSRLLDILDFKLFKDNPKPFFGHSDITALNNAIFLKTGLESYSGLILKEEIGGETRRTLEYCLKQTPLIFSHQNFLRKGVGTGHLIGGNLTVFLHLLGTQYFPEVKGNILLLEDVGEKPYELDRKLRHLLQAGIFSQVSGVIFGSFYHCEDGVSKADKWREVIKEYGEQFPCPVVIDFNYGHHPNSVVLAIGSKVEISSLQGTVTFYD